MATSDYTGSADEITPRPRTLLDPMQHIFTGIAEIDGNRTLTVVICEVALTE